MSHSNVYIIAVPTPIDRNRQPDLTPVIATAQADGIKEIKNRSGDSISIVSSMEDFLRAMLEAKPKENAGLGESLLPNEYSLECVMKKYTALINAINQT